MQQFDTISLAGHVQLVLRDASGAIKKIISIHNAIETAGKNAITDQLLASPTLGKPTYIGVGTGTPVGGNLAAEVAREAIDSKLRTDNVLTMVSLFEAGVGTGNLTEAGVYDADTSGNCLATISLPSVLPKGSADTLEITWTWTIG